DLREAKGIERTRIRTMFNSQTYELFLNDVEVPAGNRIGAEGHGFEPLLHVLNPERILIASECIGDSRWFIDRSVEYAKGRVVFGRALGSNQRIQFPLADAHARLVAAALVRWHATAVSGADAATEPAVRAGEQSADDRQSCGPRGRFDRLRSRGRGSPGREGGGSAVPGVCTPEGGLGPSGTGRAYQRAGHAERGARSRCPRVGTPDLDARRAEGGGGPVLARPGDGERAHPDHRDRAGRHAW